jgi:hypothetical protein
MSKKSSLAGVICLIRKRDGGRPIGRWIIKVGVLVEGLGVMYPMPINVFPRLRISECKLIWSNADDVSVLVV